METKQAPSHIDISPSSLGEDVRQMPYVVHNIRKTALDRIPKAITPRRSLRAASFQYAVRLAPSQTTMHYTTRRATLHVYET
jgi:hypothetical protein